MNGATQRLWAEDEHEAKVQKFYSSGIRNFHDYHNGYLNFGYWTRPGMRYEEAAENLVRHMGELLKLDASSRLLDVGCGMGTQDVYFARRFGVPSIDALDVTWMHVAIARERAARNGLSPERMRFHHGTAVALPFDDESFTHLVSIEAPEHFDTREDFFREAYRVLKPGSVMALADYSLTRKASNRLEKGVLEFARGVWNVPKANMYDHRTYRRKLEAAGFRNVSIENVGKWTIPGYYFEHCRLESVRKMWKVRGLLKGVVGGYLVDLGVYAAFKAGLCEYIIVRAEKT